MTWRRTTLPLRVPSTDAVQTAPALRRFLEAGWSVDRIVHLCATSTYDRYVVYLHRRTHAHDEAATSAYPSVIRRCAG